MEKVRKRKPRKGHLVATIRKGVLIINRPHGNMAKTA